MTGYVAPAGLIARSLAESHATLMQVAQQADAVAAVAAPILATLAGGGKLLLCGNGGSAADAQHVAAELVVRFRRERRALPAIALTTDTSQLTAIGNDYDLTRMFARQVEAGTGEGNANALLLHFGLGASDAPVDILIRWPDGMEQSLSTQAVDRVIDVTRARLDDASPTVVPR